MRQTRLKTLAVVWSQFAAYHVDRCEALGKEAMGKAEIVAVEVATSSNLYAWEPSGDLAHARKVTLFQGSRYEEVSPWARFRKLYAALKGCDVVYIGIGYHEPEIIPLVWLLRLRGVKAIMMVDSKFDDSPRRSWFEFAKSLGLSAYAGAIVAGKRHLDYVRFLGFRRRPVLLGYDCVGVERIRNCAPTADRAAGWAEKPFLFVGRFVDKKNLMVMLDAYALYRAKAGQGARRLVLVGDGPDRGEVERKIADLSLEGYVAIEGFMSADKVALAMSKALALVLVSHEEQWGLVINEAVALGLPVIASSACGATDILVRNLVNGFVVDHDDVESIAQAMVQTAQSQADWQAMSDQSMAIAPLGDAGVFARSVMQLAQ